MYGPAQNGEAPLHIVSMYEDEKLHGRIGVSPRPFTVEGVRG